MYKNPSTVLTARLHAVTVPKEYRYKYKNITKKKN
jgi:hypothetical protein